MSERDAIEAAETTPLDTIPPIPGIAPEGVSAPSRLLVPSLWKMLLGMAGGLGVAVAVILIANPHIATDVHNAQRASVQPGYLLLALLCVAVVIVTDAWSLLILACPAGDSCQGPRRMPHIQ